MGKAGQFGPKVYARWKATVLGEITETIERHLIRRLAGDVAGCNVLDIGCGDGALTLELRRDGASLAVGCDTDPRMIGNAIAAATEQQAAPSYLLAAAEHLPFCSRSFDLVTAVTVLAFVAEPDAALREIARVLKPGGRLVIGELGKWSLWAASRRLRGLFGLAPIWSAARFRTPTQLRVLAEAAGLRLEEVVGAVYYPRSAVIAKCMARLDPILARLTTFGAAFLALSAEKPDRLS